MCLLPSAAPASVSGHAGPVRLVSLLCLFLCLWLRPSRRMSTIQNLRKSLVRDWKPVCSLVREAVSGAEFAPFPSPLPPASGRGEPVRSRLALLCILSVLRSGNGRVVPKFRAFPRLILSLLLSHSLSCYLTLAPSDCPQGTQAWSLP